MSEAHQLKLHINGLEVYAYHGVLPEEKKLGQPFVFDIVLSLSESKAAESDVIEDTVDYADVCDLVIHTATRQSFNLLEKLASETAGAILRRYPAVASVKLKVTKTSPPIPHPVQGVAVSIELTRVSGRGDLCRET